MAEKRIDPKQPEKAEPAAGTREAERTSLKKHGRVGLKKKR